VLLDLKMPRIDGHEVLRRLKADPRTQTIPVVILSSSAERSDVLRAYQGGANSYVVKPVGYEKFREAIADLGAYWLGLNHPSCAEAGPDRGG
jgi:two-component system, response regulator